MWLVASRLATFYTDSDVNFYAASHTLVTALKIQFSCRSVVCTKELFQIGRNEYRNKIAHNMSTMASAPYRAIKLHRQSYVSNIFDELCRQHSHG